MFDFEKNMNNSLLAGTVTLKSEIPFCFRLKTWSYSIVHYRQYNGRRKASFELSYKRHNMSTRLETVVFIDLAIDNALGVIFNFVCENRYLVTSLT